MWATNIIGFGVTILQIPANLVSIVVNLAVSVLAVIPPLFLVWALPMTILWLPQLGLLLGTAWLWHVLPAPVRPIIAIVGIPLALVSNTFVVMLEYPGLTPDYRMAKRTKQAMSQMWPYVDRDPAGELQLSHFQDSDSNFFSGVLNYVTYATEANS